ncbi:unnamed protein product [Vicia faba]|uniref:Uncharacterized protein n=1 Tax=Vicia faba TaxID=3906 RepID=A0AAV1ABV3_VICFA|nr:unnamed protein product [Vicia faba]
MFEPHTEVSSSKSISSSEFDNFEFRPLMNGAEQETQDQTNTKNHLVQPQLDIEAQTDLQQVILGQPQPEVTKYQIVPEIPLNQQPRPYDHHLSPTREADDVLESITLALSIPSTPHPTQKLNLPPYVIY